MSRLLFFTFFFFISFSLSSNYLPIKRLDIQDGLSYNYVVDIEQDADGYIWIATESGLNRFDGKGFIQFKKSYVKDGRLSGNELNDIYADNSLLWIATQRQGLNAYDYRENRFVVFKNIPNDSTSLTSNDVTDIAPAGDNKLWVSTYYNGFELFDKNTGVFQHFNKKRIRTLPSNNIWKLCVAPNNILYIGHVSHGLSLYNIKTGKVTNFRHNPLDSKSISGNEVRSLCIDRNNNLWIGTNNGLSYFDSQTQTFINFDDPKVKNKRIFAIKCMRNNQLWIGIENGGVCILDLNKNVFVTLQNAKFSTLEEDANELKNVTVRSLFEDSFNNSWIGTYGKGIGFISGSNKNFYQWSYSPLPSKANSLSNCVAWGICADDDDRLWIGTDGGGINVFEKEELTDIFTKQNSGLADNAILCAMRDSENNLWFGTFSSGVAIYNTKNKSFTKLHFPNLPTIDVRCLFEDKDKHIWIGTDQGVFVYHLNTKDTVHYTTANSDLPENLIRSITMDQKGNYWIGTYGKGVALFDKKFKLLNKVSTDNGLYSNMVNHLICDTESNMWAATGEGLVRFARGNVDSIRIFTEEHGFINSSIRALAFDNQNGLWASSNGGITRLDLHNYKLNNYTHQDGLPMGDFMSGSIAKTTDGTLYWGSQNGVCYFHPSLVQTDIVVSPVKISQIMIYDDPYTFDENEDETILFDPIELKHTQNSFKIIFNQLNYAITPLVEYAYRLVGLSDKWYSTDGENNVTFRNLPHGDYIFEVKSRIRNGNWSEDITSKKIKISPPFWLSWYAKLCYFLLLATAILIIIKFYKKRLDLEHSLVYEKKNLAREQDLNKEKLRFYTNVAHELRTPLTLIVGPIEDLLAEQSFSLQLKNKLTLIYKNTTKLLELVNQILYFRKIESLNRKLCVSKSKLSDVIKEIGMKYKELVRNPTVEVIISFEASELELYFDAEVINTIIDNLVSNAIKFTHVGSVSLILRRVEIDGVAFAEIEVRDTGCGIDQDIIPRIFDRYYQGHNHPDISGTGIGLALVESLSKIHEIDLLVASEINKGSSFLVRLAIENTYADAIHIEIKEGKKHIAEENEQESSKQLILVIDDNIDILEYINTALKISYRVITQTNAKDAISNAIQYIPDLIVSDIMMPNINGIDLCEILKKDVRTSHIPIILLSAKDSIQDKTDGYTAGADSYITKPFSSALLNTRINNLLENRRQISKMVGARNPAKNSLYFDALSQLDNEFLEKVTNVIKDNLDSEKIDVAFIAQQMNMSHSTFYRKMKSLTGLTANEFSRKVKITSAEKLLLTGKYNISEVAYWVGMSSMTYFRQCFKDEFGIAPSEYLRRVRNKEI